jgi:hypothetical protein
VSSEHSVSAIATAIADADESSGDDTVAMLKYATASELAADMYRWDSRIRLASLGDVRLLGELVAGLLFDLRNIALGHNFCPLCGGEPDGDRCSLCFRARS